MMVMGDEMKLFVGGAEDHETLENMAAG